MVDVATAIEYLKTRSAVNADAIGVVGASVGGNLAYVTSGAFAEVKTAVSMSPNAKVKPDIRDWLAANLPLSSGE